MAFEFGDVVLVPFPFTDQTASKQRPAVIVSNAAYNLAKPDVVVMAITSQFRPNVTPGEIWIEQWRAAGFATLEQGLIIRQLGKLASVDQAALKRAISEAIA